MKIEDWRAQPEMAGLSDNDIVQVIHQTYYPDLDVGKVADSLGVKVSPPPPPPVEDRGLMGWAQDSALALGKGAVALPEAAVGLADLATGGRAGKVLQEGVGIPGTDVTLRYDPKAAKDVLSEQHTPAQKAANKAVMDAEGLWETVKAAAKNPSVAGMSVLESLPLMLGGATVGRGVVALGRGQIGAGMAGALGEGVSMAGSAAEAIRQETKDGRLTGDQSALAVGTGAAGTAFGLLGAKIAARYGVDIDTLLVGATTNGKAAKQLTKAVLSGAVAEGLLEELPQSVAEQVAQNMALGKPLDEGVSQAAVLGTMAGGLMGGGANLYSGLRAPRDKEEEKKPPPAPAAPRPTPADILQSGSVDEAVEKALRATGATPDNLPGGVVDKVKPDPFADVPVTPAPGATNVPQPQAQPASNGGPDPFAPAAPAAATVRDGGPLSGAVPGPVDAGAPVQPGAGQPVSGMVSSGRAVEPAGGDAAQLLAARARGEAPAAGQPAAAPGNAGSVGGGGAAGVRPAGAPDAAGGAQDGQRNGDTGQGVGAQPATGSDAQGGGAAGKRPDVTPHALALRLARASAAVGEAEGRLKTKDSDGNRMFAADSRDVENAVSTAIADARRADPAAWAAYDEEQKAVAALDIGARVETPDGPGTLLRKFPKNWHIEVDGVGRRTCRPARCGLPPKPLLRRPRTSDLQASAPPTRRTRPPEHPMTWWRQACRDTKRKPTNRASRWSYGAARAARWGSFLRLRQARSRAAKRSQYSTRRSSMRPPPPRKPPPHQPRLIAMDRREQRQRNRTAAEMALELRLRLTPNENLLPL
jgi:hypothetical protein